MDSIAYRAGYKYQLVQDYAVQIPILPPHDISIRFIRLTKDGWLTIREDYAWDGPTDPAQDAITGMRASLVHDALYQLIREGALTAEQGRGVADLIFFNMLKEDGMLLARAQLWYQFVSTFGQPYAAPESIRPIRYAPRPPSLSNEETI